MTTTTPAILDPQAAILPRSQPLLAVMTWELRRLRASRTTWLLPLAALILFLVVRWTQRLPIPWGPLSVSDHASLRYTFSSTIEPSSPWALTTVLPTTLVFLLAVTLPFVCADGVALDLKRRTHELLMTTSLPTWAYVLGRYLIVLGLSLGLAVLLLIAILGMALALHLGLGGADQPPPQVGPVLAFWAALLQPTVILVSSLSFALGTVLP